MHAGSSPAGCYNACMMRTETHETKPRRSYGRTKYRPVAFTLPHAMIADLALAAEMAGVSRSAVVRRAIAALLRVRSMARELTAEE